MSSHKVTLVFEDGRSFQLDSDDSNTVYLTALINKVRIKVDCLNGTCATCKGFCSEGDYSLDEYSDLALSQEEAERREVLSCQMHALSDCVIEYPYPSTDIFKNLPEPAVGRIASVETVAADVSRLVVEMPTGGPGFLPGQYVHLGIPGTDEVRSYSFSNSPAETGALEFFVKLLPAGAMSDYLRERAAPGDEMTVTGPFGHFYLRTPARPILMVAGGTGLAPMLAMLDHLAAADPAAQPVHLLYGANRAGELFGGARLDAVSAAGVGLTVERAVVDAGSDWTGAVGHVTDLLRPELVAGGECDVYLCGPPAMIEVAEGWLAGQGVDRRRIHAEKFLPS